jgi:glycosyltransferase involved in cell wall biosynthesis
MAKHRLRHASAVIAIAQRYEQDLAAAGLDGGKVQVIDDAVDLGRFRPDPSAAPALRQEIGLADCLLVGLVGRIEPFKCVREFVDIIAPLAGGADGRVAFLVVGQPGPRSYYKALLETVRQRGLSRQVIFTGRRDDMPRVMAGLDVLVTLSGGSTMFEAMACGACVLSVRADGRHSVHTRHDQTAWCVTTNQHQPATAALAQLLADGERRRRLGNAGRIQVQEHLSAGRMVVATAALYERFAVC